MGKIAAPGEFRRSAKTFCDARMAAPCRFPARNRPREPSVLRSFCGPCLFSVRHWRLRAIPFAGGRGRRYNPGPRGDVGL